MDNIKGKDVINGTFGTCWIDGDKFAEVTKLQAKGELKITDVPLCGQLNAGTKVTGIVYKGSLKMHKVSSRLTRQIAEAIRKGEQPEFTIVSKLADPSARGFETVVLYGVKFSEVNLIDWEANKLCEQTLNFVYDDFEYKDSIN